MIQIPEIKTKILGNGEIIDNRFRIKKLLATGGMANVYLALDQRLGVEVALKLMHEGLLGDEKQLERFKREAQIMCEIDSNYVAATWDVGAHNNLAYLSLEYVDGCSLEAILEQSAISEIDAHQILLAISKGLKAVHSQDVTHRDLKPANVLIGSSGEVKLIDFGIAHLPNSKLTSKLERVGSLCYMPAEVWEGKAVTIQTDLYSLGVLAFELFTGSLPFENFAPIALMNAHIKKEFSNMQLLDQCSEWQKILVRKLLRLDAPFLNIDEVTHFLKESTLAFSEAPRLQQPTKQPKRIKRTHVLQFQSSPDVVKRPTVCIQVPLPKHAAIVFEIEKPSRDFLALGAFLISLQVFDGLLTSKGMARFSIQAEGNAILRFLMKEYGVECALIGAKIFAIGACVFITAVARRILWVKSVIALLSVIYLCFAIIPWIYILYYT